MSKFLVDIGSSTIKVYQYTPKKLNLMVQRSIPFKDGFDPEGGISASAKKEIFEKVFLRELESLMPNNPKWMHGARGCSAIAQAICQRYQIQTIFPSNSNIINGVARQEFRYVTISGSFRKHLEYILKIKEKLEAQGTKVLSPRFTEPKNPGERFVVFTGEEGLNPLELERHHLKSISGSDVLIVCDPEGYVDRYPIY